MGVQPCAGGTKVNIWVPFHPLNSRSCYKDPTAMGRTSPAFPQIHSTDQGTQQRLQAPWGHLTTTSPWAHPVKSVTTHNAHNSLWSHRAEAPDTSPTCCSGPARAVRFSTCPLRSPPTQRAQPDLLKLHVSHSASGAKGLRPHIPGPGTAGGAQRCQGRARPSYTAHPLPARESLT